MADLERIRLVILGGAGVGKSSIVKRFLFKTYTDKYRATVEDLYNREYDLGGVTLKVDILDTSGDMQFPAMRRLSIATAHAFMLVYATTSGPSFQCVKQCFEEIREQRADFQDIPIVIAGNKSDLAKTHREVKLEEVTDWVYCELPRLRAKDLECSAKEDNNVTELFKTMLSLSRFLPVGSSNEGTSGLKRRSSAYVSASSSRIRVCIVESKGHYRKAPKFCPQLEATRNMECVVGVDHLDCVRRIHKGTAHFGVLSSEDLVAARWASVEILVTSELRSHDSHFEYDVVAVVDNEADIHTMHDLKGAKLCHPGYGLKNHWTDVLANYFVSTMVAKSCDPEISISEDRIRSSARFFGPSCKAGPWVPNPQEDRRLKDRYPSLCQMCYDPYRCDVGDKHWGRRGALYCVTSGGGSVAWARLDDVKSPFWGKKPSGLMAQANPTEYSNLCADGYLQPTITTNPCIWLSKPWPVIAARRSHAAQVQRLVAGINHDTPNSWQNALLSLLENYHVDINTLDNVIPVDDYLDQAVGFQSAYSFPECSPPRSIVFCTSSIIEHIQCSWLQEAVQVYDVQPNIQCIRLATLDTCLDDIKYKAADVVLVDNEQRIKAQRKYKLKPILFEYAQSMHDLYTTVAVVHKDAKLYSHLRLLLLN